MPMFDPAALSPLIVHCTRCGVCTPYLPERAGPESVYCTGCNEWLRKEWRDFDNLERLARSFRTQDLMQPLSRLTSYTFE